MAARAASEAARKRSSRAAALVFLLFLPMASIGTLGHELGHLLVAWWLGYETTLHYGSISWDYEPERPRGHCAWITLGGPAQTLVTGTIGVLWLIALRARARRGDASRWQAWPATLLALFWSREAFNALLYFAGLKDEGASLDEQKLSLALGWPDWALPLATGIAGLLVCAVVVLALHPRGTRLALVLGGASGGLAGYFLWYGLLGPRLLP